MSEYSPRVSTESVRISSQPAPVELGPDVLAPGVEGPMVWKGNGLSPTEYVVNLTPSDIERIRHAVMYFSVTMLSTEAISKKTFPLSADLEQMLTTVGNTIHRGTGVAVLRGLDEANFNDKEATIALAGIGCYVAAQRASDSYANQALSHIRDATHDTVPEWAEGIGLAGSKTTSAMEFHSDRFAGDVLVMHVRDDGGPDAGGEQRVASFWTIYNELLEKEPAVLETLAAADWPFELKQKNKASYLELSPILFFSGNKPICQVVRAPLVGSPQIPRDPSMPDLSPKQIHALDTVEKLANRFGTKLDRQKGDIQFINNLSILHNRSAYGTKKQRSSRHFLRMFLRDPGNAWEKPATWRKKFDDPFTPGRPQELPIVDLDPWRKISGRDSHG